MRKSNLSVASIKRLIKQGKSVRAVAVALGAKRTTVRDIMRKAGIKSTFVSNKFKWAHEHPCEICSTPIAGKRFCSHPCYRVFMNTAPHHVKSMKEYRKLCRIRGTDTRIKLIDSKGASCSKCGYGKNYSALQFHHKKGTVKLFTIDSRICSRKSSNELKQEVRKCVLLCANCHIEVHNPDKKIIN